MSLPVPLEVDTLFQSVRNALVDNSAYLAPFLPIARGQRPLETMKPSDAFDPTKETEIEALCSFIRNEFPNPHISSLGRWCHKATTAMPDPSILEIHGRLAAAFEQPQTQENNTYLQFIVLTIILHALGHAIHNRFVGVKTNASAISEWPYHLAAEARPGVRQYREQGFAVEEGLFGGILGVVFQNEEEVRGRQGLGGPRGTVPKILEADWSKIDHLFIQRRDGSVYRIDPSTVEQRLRPHLNLDTFDFSKLQKISPPTDISLRTFAMFNGDHLLNADPGVGADTDEHVAGATVR
ncbi:unnamed protein product [Somion occarium]|uniref:Uncharacterized protein n=1 Tax=Somion occarium TaxID=3059160 RepID=A0ABP1CTZ8_9APHY